MKPFKLKRIRIRFTTWFLLLTIVPLFSNLTVTYLRQVTIIENNTIDKLIAIRDLKVIELKNWISERISDLQTISVDKELTDLEFILNKTSFNEADNEILETSRNILNRYLKNYSAYEEIFIIDPVHAKILVSTNRLMEGEVRLTDEYFSQALQSGEVSFKDIYYSNTLLKNTMAYSIPIFCENHSGEHIVGILVARINLEKSLYKMLLNRVGLGTSGETLIVNEDVFALNELRWYDDAPLKLQISAESAVNAAAGQTGVSITTDYRNQDIMAAYTYIPETKWGFICKQDMVELNAPINKLLINLIGLFIITVIIVFFMSFVISKSISKPIINLNRIAKKIKAGNLSARSNYTSKDEVGELSLVFNTMADAVESRMKTQTEVSAISETMIKQTSLHEFSSSLLKHMMKITGANISIFYILNEIESKYEHFVSFGTNKELIAVNENQVEDEFKNALAEKNISFLNDISEQTILKYKTVANKAVPKEIITIPVLVDNHTIALISLVNVNNFNSGSFEVLKQSWQSVNVSYSNLLSNERTRILAESLVRTNEQLEEQSGKLMEQSEKLLKSTDELQAANSELESFAYSVSHDLKAPLRAISQLSYWISEDYKDILEDDGKEQLYLLVGRVKRMDALIDGILQYSRIGRVRETEKLLNLNTLVEEVIDSLAPPENIKINIVNVLPEIYGDESRFVQVFQNLISNSIKFSDKTKGKINIACSNEGNNWEFSVEDNGPGIEKKYYDRVFRIFQTLNARDTQEGTGLGLALVKKIVTYYKGKIWIKSTVEKGTTIYFTLPKKR
ncbi:MAG: HAMP domain-containing protein [Draconibacterium sp.]|nr:HAMP domain-containing protein [Draconibacterium sp.]